jgi:uncharacterized protein involved in exopolysaccharide biosynthesis
LSNENKDREMMPSLRDVLSILFKHKYGIVLLCVIIITTVTVATYIIPLSYKASSKFLVKFDREDVPLAGTSQSPRAILTMRSTEENIRTEIEILQSNSLIEGVVDELWDELTLVEYHEPTTMFGRVKRQIGNVASGAINWMRETGYRLDLFRKLSPRDAQVKMVRQNLSVEAVGDANVILVSFSSIRPELCARVTNAITEAYFEHHIKVHKRPRAHEFFKDQRDMYRGVLLEQEEGLRQFKEQSSISSIEIQRSLLLDNISELALAEKSLQKEIAGNEKRVRWLQGEISRRTNYKDVNSISPVLLTTDPIYGNIENERVLAQSELEGMLTKRSLLAKQLVDYRVRLKALDGKETELRNRERELNIAEEKYKLYVSRFEDMRISEALDMERISNVTLIEPAAVPFNPVRTIPFLPTRVFHIGVGIVAGIIVGIGYAFLVEQFDHTFNSREEMERVLDVPCVAVVPRR